MPRGGEPNPEDATNATRVPFRLLSALIVITVLAVFAQSLEQALPVRLDRVERHLLWFLPLAGSTLLVAMLAMHTARRKAIAASELTGWRLAAFTSASNEVAWETTLDGILTFAGPHLVDVLGYRPDEIVGLDAARLLSSADEIERVRARRAESVRTAKGWADEPLTYVTKSGQLKQLSTSALLRRDKVGRPVGFTGILRQNGPGTHGDSDTDAVAARIQRLLDSDELQIALQPIVHTTSGAVLGAEALSRFPQHPESSPERWFVDAARVGLRAHLELLAITLALESTWRLPRGSYLSINTSPTTLVGGQVHRLISESPWPATQVIVEITEHASVDCYDELRPSLADLRALGVRLAVDDAGSGYASFRHILELQPDYIKLDRQLIDGIDHDPAKRALVVALVSFGREVGAGIVAEGIETASELATVTRLGVDAAQGYHTGRPQLSGSVEGLAGRD